MMKKTVVGFLSILLIFIFSALSQGGKVVVIADSAHIYAEPNHNSYLIETVEKGTILTLFQKRKVRDDWYYIAFDSKERRGKVSGFIQDSVVTSSAVKEAFTPLFESDVIIPDRSLENNGQIVASSTLESKVYQKISEPLVEIELKDMHLPGASSVLKKRAYQEIVVPPVKIKATAAPLIRPSPVREEVVFGRRRTSKKVAVAFPEVLFPPVEIQVKKASSINPLPTLKTSAFETIDQCPTSLESRRQLVLNPSISRDVTAFPSRSVSHPPAVKEEISLTSFSPGKVYSSYNLFSELETAVFLERKVPPSGEAEAASLMEITDPGKRAISWREIPEKFKSSQQKEEQSVKPVPLPMKNQDREFRRVTLGLGYGQSLGGAGGFIQINTRSGISFHGGVGYYPTSYIYSGCDWVKDVPLFSGGIKYYLPLGTPPLRFYLDLQFGGIGVEAAQIVKGIWQYTFVFDYKQKTLWGPAFLGGLELRLGRIGINGALGLSYSMTELDWEIQKYFLIFDAGLLFYF
jgi:hypothetical protein